MSDRNKAETSGVEGKKRYRGRGRGRDTSRRPRRGGPGALLTCETGREVKCEREGLEILRYYDLQRNDNRESPSNPNNIEQSSGQRLSLDEEIAMLQRNPPGKEKNDAFAVYETTCRGTVFIMCTMPDCSLITPIRTNKTDNVDDASEPGMKRKADEGTKQSNPEEVNNKKRRLDEKEDSAVSVATAATDSLDPPWDPVETVQRVMSDLRDPASTAPSSRFVTRMIPIQATCFASMEEIELVTEALIAKYLARASPSTFAVAVKRRNCTHVTRDQVINTIVKQVMDMNADSNSKWKVDLKSPEYTVVVEIVCSLCGVSIVRNAPTFRNFNLAELRDKQHCSADDSSEA